MFKGLMTGVSGVRGVVGEGMTPEVALLWSSGFGTWVKGGRVVVGRDTRPSGEVLSCAVVAGLCGAGCDVDDLGVVPTPVAALAVERRGAVGGIVISASHNPQEWNALKFIRCDGMMITARDFDELIRIVSEGPLRSVGWEQLGTINRWDGAEVMYLSSVTGLRLLNLERMRRRQFKVAIDCVEGAGSFIYPRLLEAFGCQVVPLNAAASGIFPHPPEPKAENLAELSRTVASEECAVGFAVDPDGDRLAVVDERGHPIGEENTLALAVSALLEQRLGPVVVNSLTTQAIEEIAAEFGVECSRTKVGEANVSARMKELGAVIGGEGNGGIIIPELHLVRDAGAGMAIILNRLAAGKMRISELAGKLPSYRIIKSAYPIGEKEPSRIINAVTKYYEHDQLSSIDGLRVTHSDGWIQLRPSNTEPILRVFAESKDEGRARELLSEMMMNIENSLKDLELEA